MSNLNIDEYKVQPNDLIYLGSYQTDIDRKNIREAEIEEKLAKNTGKLQEMQQRLLAEEKQGIIFV